jgi:hypothetical protein
MALWYSRDLGAASVQFHRIEYAYGTRIEATAVNLPIQFPDDADVIAEEAARFRALTPVARIRSIRGIIDAGAIMIRNSPKAAFLREYSTEQEIESRISVQEFIARHAR